MKTTWSIMGMPISLEALGPRVNRAVFDEVQDYLHWVDRQFSTYKPESQISRLNRGELSLEAAGPEVRQVLAECERLRVLTRGYFNIRRGQGEPVDPSGYVKGWAIRQAVGLLERRGIRRYCLEAGGDMQLRGPGPDGDSWKIGIAHPLHPNRLAKVVYLSEGAVATSGTYRRGHHIYDPHSGQTVTDPLSLTVIGDSIDQVDALATAAFSMGRPGLSFVYELRLEAMMITADQQVLLTPGFARYEQT